MALVEWTWQSESDFSAQNTRAKLLYDDTNREVRQVIVEFGENTGYVDIRLHTTNTGNGDVLSAVVYDHGRHVFDIRGGFHLGLEGGVITDDPYATIPCDFFSYAGYSATGI